MEYFIVADIAGQYKTLMALLDKAPKNSRVISLGDCMDRGPQSKEVMEFFMTNPDAEVIMGNHCHLMLDHYGVKRECEKEFTSRYPKDCWPWNGGKATLKSFGDTDITPVLDFISKLPLYKEIKIGDDTIFVAHSFLTPKFALEDSFPEACKDIDDSIFWNRRYPVRIPKYKLQLAGHNSQFGYRRFSDEQGEFAICLDASSSKVLTGIHLPSMEVFQQEYIN